LRAVGQVTFGRSPLLMRTKLRSAVGVNLRCV